MKYNYSLLITFVILFLNMLNFYGCGKKPSIRSVRPQIGPVESTVTTTNSGTIEAKNQAELAFGSQGRIAKIYVQMGDIVSAGKVIAELENRDLKAIDLDAKKELQRGTELFDAKLISSMELEKLKKNNEVAKTQLEKTIIKAPFAGMVTAMNLKVGEFYSGPLQTGSTPKINVQIIDLSTRIIKGEIDEIDLSKVKVGMPAKVKIPALKNKIVNATVTKVVPFVSTLKDQDRTSQIELELAAHAKTGNSTLEENKEELIPVGASADIEIIIESKSNVLSLPTQVFTGTGTKRFCYIIENGKVKKTEVTTGIGNYEKVEIISGITPSTLIAWPKEGIELSDGIKIQHQEMPWH